MATYFSKQSGNWSSATTWVTGAGDFVTMSGWAPTGDASLPPQSFGLERIIIRGDHTVTYDVSGAFGNGIFRDSDLYPLSAYVSPYECRANAIILSGGRLKADRTVNTSLSCIGTLGIALSGFLDWGTELDPLLVKSEIVLVNTTDGISVIDPITGTVTSTTSAGVVNRGTNTGIFVLGSSIVNNSMYNGLSICGNERTVNTELTVQANAGATTITVLSALNWEIGDDLALESNNITNSNIHRCKITNISNKTITISPALNITRSVGTKVGNFTSNVTIRPGYINYQTGGFFINGMYRGDYLIKNCSVRHIGCQNILRDDGQVAFGTVVAQSTYDGTYSLSQLKIQNVSNPEYLANWQRPFFSFFGSMANDILVDNVAIDSGAWAFQTVSYTTISNSVIYSASGLTRGSHKKLTLNKCTINAPLFEGNSGAAAYTAFNNCTIKSPNQIYFNSALGELQFNQCDIFSNSNAGAYVVNGIYITTNSTLTNCNLSGANLYEDNNGATLFTSRESNFNVFNAVSGNITNIYKNFNYHHFSEANSNIRKNGSASYAIRQLRANNSFAKTFNTYVVGGDVQKIKGNIRLNSTYDTSLLPTITFGGVVDNYVYTPPSVTDTWTSFEFDLTPKYSGNLTVEIKAQSPTVGPNSYIYIDGLKLDPFVQAVRWYGYEVDTNFSRKIDASTTLTEKQASAYPVPYNLNYVYDECRYYTIANPASSYYIDIVNKLGSTMDFGSANIILDDTFSTNFQYLTSSNELTLKTLSLSSGNKFDKIQTTGNVYLSGASNLKNVDLNATLISEPKSLTNVNATNVKYNAGSTYNITYKNCTIDNLTNTGAGMVNILLNNATVTNHTGNLTFSIDPTFLNVYNLNGGYISIFDDNGELKYYTKNDQLIQLPNGSTGTWTYKIGRYNYKTIEGAFAVNPLVGTTIDIAPLYFFDSFVFETNVSNVSSYSIFDNVQKVYDYFSYFRTTSAGLSGYSSSDLYNYRSTLDVINNNIVLDPSAPTLFNYDGKTFTLSSKKLESGTIVKAMETTDNIYLSGSATLSGLNITVGGGLYIKTIFDLYSTNVYSGTIVYNTDSAANIIYTDCIINKVVNDPSTYTIFITRINSTITDATDAEIVTTVPISINITATSDTYVAIYKPNGTRYYYGTGNATLILGGDAVTGTWTYKVTRYGYIQSTNTFGIDVNMSSVTNISPTLLIDTAITESVVGTVAAYTSLTTTKKIYDYLAYYNTTSTGIDTNISVTRTPGSIAFIAGITLDATASDMVSYQTTPTPIVTLKSTALSEIVDIYSNGDFTQSNGNIISNSVYIRANNIDSEIELIGITNIKFYPSQADRDTNTNVGPSISTGIYRFKYGNTYSGVLFSGTMWTRADVGSILLYSFTLNQFYNILDLGTFGQIQQVLNSQDIINKGIQKASVLIPHTIDV